MFLGEPQSRSDSAIASAKEFYLFFKDRELQRAELVDPAALISRKRRMARKRILSEGKLCPRRF